VNFVYAVAQVVTADDGIGQDAGSTRDGSSGDLAVDSLDQLTGCPVDFGFGFKVRRSCASRYDRNPYRGLRAGACLA